jgi:cytochrome c peroxidase
MRWALLLICGCVAPSDDPCAADFPPPLVPPDNAPSEPKIDLGRHLFYDKRLSENQTQSCASCHKQSRAFTDGRTLGLGSTGDDHPRNAMTLTNVAYLATLGWADPELRELEQQASIPMFAQDPIELGMHGLEDLLLERLRQEPRYQELFPLSFPEETDPFSVTSVVRALSAFERTLISSDSPYDRFVRSEPLSAQAERGRRLFESEALGCRGCHVGFNFTDSVRHGCSEPVEIFHNNGLYNLGGTGAFPAPNTGLHAITGRDEDMGKFRVPTLRNISKTAPYMHDGSIATLDEVLDHYSAGGRTIDSGPLAGDGSASRYKDERVTGFELSASERAHLLAFFESLTDETFLADPRFANPW